MRWNRTDERMRAWELCVRCRKNVWNKALVTEHKLWMFILSYLVSESIKRSATTISPTICHPLMRSRLNVNVFAYARDCFSSSSHDKSTSTFVAIRRNQNASKRPTDIQKTVEIESRRFASVAPAAPSAPTGQSARIHRLKGFRAHAAC